MEWEGFHAGYPELIILATSGYQQRRKLFVKDQSPRFYIETLPSQMAVH
jgi:hypothetical protein